MPDEVVGDDEEKQGKGEDSNSDANLNPKSAAEEEDGRASSSTEKGSVPLVSVVIAQPEDIPGPKGNVSKGTGVGTNKDDKASVAALKKGCLMRNESYDEQCRVCQQKTEEDLMDLGCRCRGDLAKVHRSCIDIWFHTKGSNKCEICQYAAANVPFPESQPSTNYWVWRVDPAFGQSNIGRGEQERRCCSPLWIAFTVLIAGLLLDVIISVSLGVSALPVNVIIGVLIVLGLGTAVRLALECCHGWCIRREVQRVNTTINIGHRPAV